MSVIYVLIPIAILLTALGIYLFFWAVKTDQFDDLEKQGLSILFDEDKKKNGKPQDSVIEQENQAANNDTDKDQSKSSSKSSSNPPN